jgi:fumarylpyruvate hydrolase
MQPATLPSRHFPCFAEMSAQGAFLHSHELCKAAALINKQITDLTWKITSIGGGATENVRHARPHFTACPNSGRLATLCSPSPHLPPTRYNALAHSPVTLNSGVSMNFQLPCYHRQTGASAPDVFNVVRIICMARNYPDHSIEMGHKPDEALPYLFFKPITALNTSGTFAIPAHSNDVHHEIELVLALTSGGKNLNADQAKACIGGFAVGLDMTCRDTQDFAKKNGRPWEMAKGFDQSAPCSPIALGSFADLDDIGNLTLKLNGKVAQNGSWREMVWQPLEMIQELSKMVELRAGDLIYTGTPAGVGRVQVGDIMEASIGGIPQGLTVTVVE